MPESMEKMTKGSAMVPEASWARTSQKSVTMSASWLPVFESAVSPRPVSLDHSARRGGTAMFLCRQLVTWDRLSMLSTRGSGQGVSYNLVAEVDKHPAAGIGAELLESSHFQQRRRSVDVVVPRSQRAWSTAGHILIPESARLSHTHEAAGVTSNMLSRMTAVRVESVFTWPGSRRATLI